MKLHNSRLYLLALWVIATFTLATYMMLQATNGRFASAEALDWLRGALLPVLGLVLPVGIADVAAPPVSTRTVSRSLFWLAVVASVLYILTVFAVAVAAGLQAGASTLEENKPWVAWLSAVPAAFVALFFARGERPKDPQDKPT